MVQIYDFPREFYELIVTQKFPLRSLNQAAVRPFGNTGNAISGPHSQLFVSDVTMAPMMDPDLQDIDAFITRLRGRANAVRIGNALRLSPWYDRNLAQVTKSKFSDGTIFTDGTGFSEGYLPPEVYVQTKATRGENFLVLDGFPRNIKDVIRRGDFFQIKPNGIPAPFPHLYKAMFNVSSNNAGRLGVEIEPKLRVGVAAGDVVSLRYPTSVFRMADDNQGDIEVIGAGIGNLGFSLVEAVDLVP